jgi:hypothetical protein
VTGAVCGAETVSFAGLEDGAVPPPVDIASPARCARTGRANFEVAEADAVPFDAVTFTITYRSESSSAIAYVRLVAPAIGVHDASCSAVQRSH